MNRTEQNNKIVFFILYFKNSFWSILLFAKYFLKLLFENALLDMMRNEATFYQYSCYQY